MQILARNEVAHWRKEKINTLSTPDLRHVPANAERPKETEVAALYDELLVYGKCLQGSRRHLECNPRHREPGILRHGALRSGEPVQHERTSAGALGDLVQSDRGFYR